MASRKLALPAAASVTALAGVYIFTGNPSKSQHQDEQGKPQRSPAAGKLNEGLGGAGVGGTATTGGHDRARGDGKENPFRQTNTDAPRESLPAGGVGGGVGAGGTNKRMVEMTSSKQAGQHYGSGDKSTAGQDDLYSSTGPGVTQPKDTTVGSLQGSNQSSQQSGSPSISQRLQGVFGQGGQSAGVQGDERNKKKFDDPKIHSNHSETPTKNAAGGGKM